MFKWLANLLAGSGGGKTSAPRQPVKVIPAKTGAPVKSDRSNGFWRGKADYGVLVTTPSDGDTNVDRVPAKPPIAIFEKKLATGTMPPQPVPIMSDDGSFNVGTNANLYNVARSDYKPYPSLFRIYEED